MRGGEGDLVAEVSVHNGRVRADFGDSAAGDDLAVGHDVDPVGQAGQEGDVMLDEQDADTARPQLADDAGEPLRQGWADAGCGLVEHDQRGVKPEHLSELYELALAVAERSRTRVRVPGQPEVGERREGPGAVGGGDPRQEEPG